MKLYHGTSKEYAKKLLEYGWIPSSISPGANQGQSRFLYLTNYEENALWFAEQSGGDIVLSVEVPEDFLIVDPEDGIGNDVLDEIKKSENKRFPANLALTKPLGPECFSLVLGNLK